MIHVSEVNIIFRINVSLSDEEEEMEGTEEDGELQIVTECWVEPQHGTCVNNPPERKEFDGLTCHQIPETVSGFHSYLPEAVFMG